MPIDYARLQTLVGKVMPKVKQGIVVLRRTTTAVGANEWTAGADTVQEWPLDAVVTRQSQTFDSGTLITETLDIVTFAHPGVTPLITDTIVIDGNPRAITDLKPTPSAGVTVVWRAAVAV